MNLAEQLTQRLKDAGLRDQQLVEVLSAIQDYVKARDRAIEASSAETEAA